MGGTDLNLQTVEDHPNTPFEIISLDLVSLRERVQMIPSNLTCTARRAFHYNLDTTNSRLLLHQTTDGTEDFRHHHPGQSPVFLLRHYDPRHQFPITILQNRYIQDNAILPIQTIGLVEVMDDQIVTTQHIVETP